MGAAYCAQASGTWDVTTMNCLIIIHLPSYPFELRGRLRDSLSLLQSRNFNS